jgi:hypothetical protein
MVAGLVRGERIGDPLVTVRGRAALAAGTVLRPVQGYALAAGEATPDPVPVVHRLDRECLVEAVAGDGTHRAVRAPHVG